MGSPRVIARSNDEVHSRILRLVGAHEVVNPELEFGERLANHLVYRQVLGELPLGDDLVMTQMSPPRGLFGKALSEIHLPRRYGITVVAIRRGKKTILLPEPNETVREEDTIVVVSREGAVARLVEENE
jgi:trk system potassium uptake protein TrkA